jgi:hypothetical protein
MDFTHRRSLLRDRMEFLAQSFALDVAAYGLMENHAHWVLRTRPDLREAWSAEEVVRRWKRVYPGKRRLDGQPVEPAPEVIAALAADEGRVATLRRRLGRLGEYMKALKEYVARLANLEDGCTGHFWEGRYKSQPLLDDAAVLAGLMYVDLNPIRAKVAQTPEESEFTSAQDRIVARQAREKLEALAATQAEGLAPSGGECGGRQADRIVEEVRRRERDAWLAPLERAGEHASGPRKGVLPVSLDVYLELLDCTGRQVREGKRGAIPGHLAPVLERLGVDSANWLETVCRFGSWFHRVVGKVESMAGAAERFGQRWFQGRSKSAQAFRPASDTS